MRPKGAIEGHRQILLALKLKDPEICERVMRIHIRQSMEDALQTKREVKMMRPGVRAVGSKTKI